MCVILKHYQGQHFVQEIATLQSDFEEESFIIHQPFRGIT